MRFTGARGTSFSKTGAHCSASVLACNKREVRQRQPSRLRSSCLALLCIVLLLAACARKTLRTQIDPNVYAKEIAQWHEQRWNELKGESGWLTLVGLFWLKEGENKFGSAASNDIVVAKLPAHAGLFRVEKGAIKVETAESGFTVEGRPVSSLDLKNDEDAKPTVIRFDSLSLQIIKRGEKLGLRIKDSQNPDRLKFQGTDFYPVDARWRIDARFEPYNPPKPMPILNVLGMESSEPSPGAIKFEVGGKEYSLDAMTEKDEPRLFMIMADKTS